MSLDHKLSCLLDHLAEAHAPYMTDYRRTDRRSFLPHVTTLAAFASQADGAIVEIGTDSGIGSLGLAHGAILGCYNGRWNSLPSVHTFDVIAQRQECACSCLAKVGVGVHPHLRPQEEVSGVEDIALAFVDGDHEANACLRDLLLLEPNMKQGGKILCHDYPNEPNGPGAAVKEFLKSRPQWRVVNLSGLFALLFREGDV